MRWRGEINKAEERITGQRKSLTQNQRKAGQRPPALQPPAFSTSGILLIARAMSTLCPGRSEKKPVLIRTKAPPTPGTPARGALYLKVNGPSSTLASR